MMSKLWDKKPGPWNSTKAMDRWADKIKPYLDLAEQVIAMFNEPLPPEKIIALYKARENAAKRYAWLFEVIEKADKWDGYQKHQRGRRRAI